MNAVKALKEAVEIKAISHITGGGFIENIPRMLKEGTRAEVMLGTWPVHSIFELMKDIGDLKETDMYNTFNMGIGMIVAVASKDADKALKALEAVGEKGYVIGSIKQGEKGLDLCQK